MRQWLGAGLVVAMLGMASCRSHEEALLDAVSKQEVGNVKRLLEDGAKADVLATGAHAYPLEVAAQGGNTMIIQMLLAARANPDAALSPETPLWRAMMNGHQEAAVMLVEAKAKLDGPVIRGITPFYFAVMLDYTDLATRMVAHGADVHAQGPQGSPLHEAAENGNLALAKLLASNGADLHRANDLGETPVFLAMQQGKWEVVEWLVENGADINAANKLGQTVLHELAIRDDSASIQRVCGMKPNPDVQNLLGETPLHNAAALGHQGAARALIEFCNADPNLHEMHHLSPAGLACREGQTEMVDFLTARGGRLQ